MSKLEAKLEAEATRLGITVESSEREIVLHAPEGQRFDVDLHALVHSRWDAEPRVSLVLRALRDVRVFGLLIRDCPPDCACKETGPA